MNKSDIVGRVALRMGLRRSVAESAVDTVLPAIGEALAKDEDVRIAGFGKFATRSRPARAGRNPRTGESVAISASKVPWFSAFPDFAEFRKHMRNIAWETEVWLCDTPDHMIHYDGERFLGPRPGK